MPTILLKQSGGRNIVLRDQTRAAYYPAAQTPAASSQVWMHEIGEEIGSAKLLGVFPVNGTQINLPFNPASDAGVVLLFNPLGPDGTPRFSSLDDCKKVVVPRNRETVAPTLGQVGAATTEKLTVGVEGFTQFARRRKVRIADNAGMTDAGVTIFDYAGKEVPKFIDILRTAGLVPDFTWNGTSDPAANGFTKTGTGATASATGGWRINTLTTDAKTFYSKTGWPASPFADGYTLELTPPTIDASDGAALPNASVSVTVEDGSKRYDLTFDASNVKLNGGTARALGTNKVRLVVAAGGANADLWIGETLVEDNTAGQSTTTSGLRFGDQADGDDANVIWKAIAYAFSPQPVRLAQTIFVKVSHSSGGSQFGPESATLEVSFASEGGSGGSSGSFDPEPRDVYEYGSF